MFLAISGIGLGMSSFFLFIFSIYSCFLLVFYFSYCLFFFLYSYYLFIHSFHGLLFHLFSIFLALNTFLDVFSVFIIYMSPYNLSSFSIFFNTDFCCSVSRILLFVILFCLVFSRFFSGVLFL